MTMLGHKSRKDWGEEGVRGVGSLHGRHTLTVHFCFHSRSLRDPLKVTKFTRTHAYKELNQELQL